MSTTTETTLQTLADHLEAAAQHLAVADRCYRTDEGWIATPLYHAGQVLDFVSRVAWPLVQSADAPTAKACRSACDDIRLMRNYRWSHYATNAHVCREIARKLRSVEGR